MMISSLKLAVTAVFIALLAFIMVSASPIVEQRAPTCKPNFEGNRQTIYYNPNRPRLVIEWTAKPEHSQRRNVPGRLVADGPRELGLSGNVNTQEVRFQKGWSASKSWEIDCESYPTPGSGKTVGLWATNCVIKQTNTNKCLTSSEDNQKLWLATCNGASNQKYRFESGN